MTGQGDDRRRLSQAELDAWRGFLRAHSALIRELDAELVAAHDLPLRSYDVLVQLEGAPGRRLRMTELSRSVLLSASGVSRLVDRLEADGLVCRQRCELDGRGYWAELTDKGLARLREARPTHLAGVRRRFLAQVGESELEALGRLWRRLLSGDDAS
jgi:DNA-binding MarR family transcriptional regulator